MNNSTVFIDWVSLAQKHLFLDLPPVGGAVRAKAEKAEFMDVDGVKYLVLSNDKEKDALGYTVTSLQHCGSHDTKVVTRCDGSIVTLSGNVGRLDRPDNVFNYGLEDTIIKASNVVQQYGLPAFTGGECIPKDTLSKHDQDLGLLVNCSGQVFSDTPIGFFTWRAQKPSATFLKDNVAWEKSTSN